MADTGDELSELWSIAPSPARVLAGDGCPVKHIG